MSDSLQKSASSAKSAVEKMKPLWKCPKCGEYFTGRNMWHSCGKFSLDDLFARTEPQVTKTFRKFAKMVRSCGRSRMIPQKTRVVFQAQMRFAGATPRKSHLICHFILPRKIDNKRFHKIETINPRCHAHYLRVNSERDLNREIVSWLNEAYTVGQQKHLL